MCTINGTCYLTYPPMIQDNLPKITNHCCKTEVHNNWDVLSHLDADDPKQSTKNYLLKTDAGRHLTQLTFCSNSTIKTNKSCKICSSLTIKTPDKITWYFYCWFWTYFTPFSAVSVFDFGQVNTSWTSNAHALTTHNNTSHYQKT